MGSRTGAEQAIAAAWRDVLGVQHVGMDDNFFDLGASSVNAVQVYTRLRESLGAQLSILDLFQHPTVRSLVDYLFPGQAAPPSFQPVLERAAKQRKALEQQKIQQLSGRKQADA
jgi:acyl carrier protein